MTLEAARLRSDEAVAALAELPFRGDWHRLALIIVPGMAVDAVGETVLLNADALAHGQITLVLDQLHVIAAHPISRTDAGLEGIRFRGTLDRLARRGISFSDGGRAQPHEEGQGNHFY
ncbi:MAG: hypothetical protein A2286_03905 [Gammaproteobacteria bacterium RIFOXYA12_FULL_61_12]|nr:MAG: hypothetical protein A2514_07175 [Gammaproteobacteria bacterium RIFOXYD12_FULL_61_37]OGT94433.1 MAG: hypothetical protein A2286_03905 [Gammaproteobacteria bacterium RIFOXYA12_FULL_61_12]